MTPFTVDDLYLHRKVTELHGIPARDDIAAVVRSVDRENDRYTSAIWVCPLDGGAAWPLTPGKGLDSSPQWAPSGKRMAYVSASEGSPTLCLISAEGGEPTSCGEATAGVSIHRWMPDGHGIAMTLPVSVDPDARGQRVEEAAPRRSSKPEVAWRLPYKTDGAGYTLNREIHLFHFDPVTGDRRQITDGPFDVMAFDVAPDARRVVYVRHREGRFAHRTDLWICDMDGSHARQLTHDLATVMQPVWSPDGQQVAFSAAQQEGDAQSGLFVLDFESGELSRIAPDSLEVAPLENAIQWMGCCDRLVVARAHAGAHQLVCVATSGVILHTLVEGDVQFGAWACTRDQWVYSAESPVMASEVHARPRAADAPPRQVTDLNAWWKERTALACERRRFEVPDGNGGQESIEGWLIRAQASPQPQPLLNDVHGGPAAYALLDFDTNVFWQVLCSQGWAVLALNPVGSASYGAAFCSRLAGRWGHLDLPQHLEAIRQLQACGETDDRITISGKSYGGYLSAWAVGHTEDFRAAVVMAPVGNIETHFGTSDGGYYADPLYMDTAPKFDRERAREMSPLQHICKAHTPTLFLQGKDDERCPKCQSEEMFVNLCRAGTTPTELVLYPDESHLFLSEGQPDCRADAAQRIVDWLVGHVAGQRETSNPP